MIDYMTAPIRIIPGIYKEGSALAAKNRYVDGNNVRFYNDYPEKIGGFQTLTAATLAQPARACAQWIANDGTKLMAWGTADKLYVWSPDTLYDVTPTGLPAGIVSASVGLSGGWGDGSWGDGYWGGSPYAQLLPPTTWTLEPWGEDLIAVRRYVSGSTVYRWSYSAGAGFAVRAVATGGTTPTDALGVVVSTLTRTAIVLGQASDPLLVTWSSNNVLNDWVTTDINTAGNFRLTSGSTLVGATEAQGGHLLLTDLAAYSMVYSGSPATFRIDYRDTQCGLIAPHAAVTLDSTAIWMGLQHFYLYDGVVQTLPCDVERYVFSNINVSQAYKICCGTNAAKGEITWYYVSLNSPDGEPDRYVTVNMRNSNRPWSIGDIRRGAYMDVGSASPYPIGVDGNGVIWQHEIGLDNGTAALPYFLETSELEISAPNGAPGNGKIQYRVRKLIPDHARIAGNHAVTFTVRNYPQGAAETQGPFALTQATTKMSVSGRGRSMRYRISGTETGTDIRLGEWRAEVTSTGEAA
jgi:hypothetical protein